MLAQEDTIRMQPCDWSLPAQRNSNGLGPCDHEAVQDRAAHADAGAVRKTCGHAQAAADKAYPAEGMRVRLRDRNSQLRERGASVGHQAFAARFVDGWPSTVRHYNVETTLTRRDGRRQSRGAATDYENIRCSLHEINTQDRVRAQSSFFTFYFANKE